MIAGIDRPFTMKELRTRAAELLSQKGVWVKHSWAVTATGSATSARSEEACGFCLSGALAHVALGVLPGSLHPGNHRTYKKVLAQIELQLGINPSNWNDAPERTLADVLALLHGEELT